MIPATFRQKALTAALSNEARRHISATPAALLADVSVEHGRGTWKTYGDISTYRPGKFQIKTFNKISPLGLQKFPDSKYEIRAGDAAANAHAILLRSHKSARRRCRTPSGPSRGAARARTTFPSRG